MQYRTDPKTGNRLSVLGYGCMRFPRGLGGIDRKKSQELVMRAIDQGVNYFDTAYLYGGSEEVLGEILADHRARDKVFLATKLPVGSCHEQEDFDRLFQVQLQRLRTDHIDYYLMHNLGSFRQWRQLCDLGVREWLAAQKARGGICQAGFSFHGTAEEFLRVLEDYPWDFCQIQYNYSDENYQAGVSGLRRAAELGMPVIIMEPLLGGKLATGLPQKAVDVFRKVDPRTPAAWGLRWLWDQLEVTVVLSGMSDMAQLEDNLRAAEDAAPGLLTDAERAAYGEVVELFRAGYKVPCTGCGYCLPCPAGVNIPGCFSAYNTSHTLGRLTGLIQYTTGTAAHREDSNIASRCVACGRCTAHCPQQIDIPRELQSVRRRMEPFYFRWAMAVMHRQARRR